MSRIEDWEHAIKDAMRRALDAHVGHVRHGATERNVRESVLRAFPDASVEVFIPQETEDQVLVRDVLEEPTDTTLRVLVTIRPPDIVKVSLTLPADRHGGDYEDDGNGETLGNV